MKKYMVIICEEVNSLQYIIVERILSKASKLLKLSESTFLFSIENDNLRIDEVCFIVSNENKADVVVFEIDKKSTLCWNINASKKRKSLESVWQNESDH